MEGRWEIELCSHCADGQSTPLIECQHIGPDEAGPIFSVVPVDDAAIERVAIRLYARSFIPMRAVEEVRWLWDAMTDEGREFSREAARDLLRAAAGGTA